jgi:hypothetical protein
MLEYRLIKGGFRMAHEKYIIQVLKNIEEGKTPSRDDYELSNEEWGEVAEIIIDANLADGVSVTRGGQGNKVLTVWYENAILINSGRLFLGKYRA